MSSLMKIWLLGLLLALLAAMTTWPTLAADKTGDKPADKAAASTRSGGTPTPTQLPSDPAFDRYVDLHALGDAWRNLDAVELADCGLQLAEGERVLFRHHKAGIKADLVLSLATRVAIEHRDSATLERLAKVAEALGKKELAAQVGAAQKLVAANPEPPGHTVTVGQTSVEGFTQHKRALARITSAKLGGDAKTLEAIAKEAPEMPGLPEVSRQQIAKAASEARAALPKDAKEPDPTIAALNKLSGATRANGELGVFLQDIGGQVMITSVIPNTPAAQVGLQPGDIIAKVGTVYISSINDALYAKQIAPQNVWIPFVIQTPNGEWDINAKFTQQGQIFYYADVKHPGGGSPLSPGGSGGSPISPGSNGGNPPRP